MAISSDGQAIWTHLNGANAVRRFDVLAGTAGLQCKGTTQPRSTWKLFRKSQLVSNKQKLRRFRGL